MWLTERSWNSHHCSDVASVQAVAVLVYYANCPATTVNRKEEEKLAEGEETETEKEEDELLLLLRVRVLAGRCWSLLGSAVPGSDAWMSVRKFGGTFQVLLSDMTHRVESCRASVSPIIVLTALFISLAYFFPPESVSLETKRLSFVVMFLLRHHLACMLTGNRLTIRS